MVILLLVLLGLCFGSFVNALTWRLHAGKDWVKGRSECTHCHHGLAAIDLIPVLSWVWLRGKCRYCHKKIDDNPLVEIMLPILFTVSYLYWPLAWNTNGIISFGLWLIALIIFMALIVYDLRWMLLPNKLVFSLMGLGVVYAAEQTIHSGLGAAMTAFWGLLIGGGLFYILFQVSSGKWIGGGDVKLGAALGLILGGPAMVVLMIFIASLLGSMVGIPLALKSREGRRYHLPFGPFLIAATIIVQLSGNTLIHWYRLHFLPS